MQFKSLEFDKIEDVLRVSTYRFFYFDIPWGEVVKVDRSVSINSKERHEILLNKKSEKRFMLLINKYISSLKSKLSKKKTIYIHENSGIPLFGLKFIGIIDKGTNMIEVKPLTGCNMNCIFCSVNEGCTSNKENDFLIEEEYLVSELTNLIKYKNKIQARGKQEQAIEGSYLDIWINPHGEPLLYSRIDELASDIAEIDEVNSVHIITTGVLLNKALINKLAKIKKLKLNISVSGFDKAKAKKLMNSETYNVEIVLKQILEAKNKGIDITITPVYLKGINDTEIIELIKWCKKNKLGIAIQKFCCNKQGRNPIKETTWNEFEKTLALWEQETAVKLALSGTFSKTKELDKPFKKGEVVEARIVCSGRFDKDKIGIAKERAVLIPNCRKTKSAKIKITSSKHGMYMGKI